MGVLGGLRSEAKALSGEAAVKRSNSAVGALKKRKKQS
jgi:hypothetical protein